VTPFLAWPGWKHLRYVALLSLANTAWFLLVYGGMDALTAHRGLRVPVHFPAELRIPLVPAMTVFYMSLYLLFLMAPFVLRTRREFRAVVWTLAVVIACAGVGFLAFPAQLAFAPPREADLGRWAGLFHLADRLNLTYNLLPSLHVAMGVVCVAVFSPRASKGIRIVLWSWVALLAAATVLTHQHHVLDVVTGWLLAIACVKTVFDRLGLPYTEAIRNDLHPMNPEDTAILIRRALDGDQTALTALVALLTPVIQARVARTLLARRSLLAGGRGVRQEVEDLSQDVFLALFDRDARVLRSWEPERGLSLPNFVGLVAERQVLSFLRSGRRNPWKEEPSFTDDELDAEAPESGPEEIVASREHLSLLLDRLRESLSPLGWRLFDLLFVQELSQAEVQAASGLSADAVYAWRSRLRRAAQRLVGEMSETPATARKS